MYVRRNGLPLRLLLFTIFCLLHKINRLEKRKEIIMPVQQNYQQYILEVKLWMNQVEQILQENNVDEEALSVWKEKMNQGLKELEDKVNNTNVVEIADLKLIEDQARGLYDNVIAIKESDSVLRNRISRIGIGEHKLPPLPYSYDALEPYISAEIMRLHHDKHHKSYVEGLNIAERKMQEARESDDFSLIKHWEREAAFHGSGHYLHTIFWNNMTPKGGSKPKGPLLKQLESDFGSFESFKRHFTEAANNVEGVGWAILVWAPRPHRLEILQSEKHQHYTQWDTIPLLVLDVWEHAYYLQYKNEKKEYVDNWWNVVNWNDVTDRFLEARKVKWNPF